MFDRKFLEEYGLYRKYWLKDAYRLTLGFDPPNFQRYCPICNGERTHYCFDRSRTGRSSGGTNHEYSDSEQPLLGSTFGYEFSCVSCHSKDKVLMILNFGIEGFGPDVYFGKTKTELAVSAKGARCYVMKIGQVPPWSIEPPAELRHALQRHEDIYKRGTICESQGYGIGAFAYYRRIVEDIIDELLNDISGLLSSAERRTYEAALSDLAKTIVAKDKIAVVKDMLPATLRPGGVNPLGTLHESLSVGLHALSEEDCLALAEGIRTSLAMLARHIVLAKQDQDEYSKSLSAVRDTLDKIKKRSEAT